jgi:hypothetical protein
MNLMLWIRKKADEFTAKHSTAFDKMMEEAKKLAKEAEEVKHRAILKANGAFVPGVHALGMKIKDEEHS